MIPHNFESLRQSREDALPVVLNDAGLAVHGERGAYNAPAEIMRDALHTEAHAEDGGGLPQLCDDPGAHAEILFVGRVAWSGGNDDAVVLPFLYFIKRNGIVAHHIERERLFR